MTNKRTEEFDLFNNLQLSAIDLDQKLDTSCLRENLLFNLRAINSSLLDESLDITLIEYNPLVSNQQHFEVARSIQPFFSIGM